MPRTLMPVMLVSAAASLCLTTPAVAQSAGTVSGTDLDAAVAAPHPDPRATLREAFASEAGQAAAARLGLDASQVADRIAALDASSAESLASRVQAGGSTIVISATTLIIILLVLILITD